MNPVYEGHGRGATCVGGGRTPVVRAAVVGRATPVVGATPYNSLDARAAAGAARLLEETR
jgi:hypothetical protein